MWPVLGKVKYHVDKFVWETTSMREKALEGGDVENIRIAGYV